MYVHIEESWHTYQHACTQHAPTVFTLISAPALMSAPPHISHLIELIFLNMPILKQVSIMFRCWDIGTLSFESVKNSLKLQTSITPQRKMIETWFNNWWAQIVMRNLNLIIVSNFVSARGAYYGEYGRFILFIAAVY